MTYDEFINQENPLWYVYDVVRLSDKKKVVHCATYDKTKKYVEHNPEDYKIIHA